MAEIMRSVNKNHYKREIKYSLRDSKETVKMKMIMHGMCYYKIYKVMEQGRKFVDDSMEICLEYCLI